MSSSNFHLFRAIEKYVVKPHSETMSGVESIQRDLTRARDTHVSESDIGEHRQLVARLSVIRVIRIHVDGILGVTDADIVIDYILNESAAAGIGFDTDTVIGAVYRKIRHPNRAGAPIGFTPDRQAVTAIEMVVRDGHVRRRRAVTGFDSDIVVTGVDEAMSDGDVSGVTRIDAIGVARVLRRIDSDAPGGKSVSVGVRNMEVGGVTQAYAVEGEIVSV